MRAQAAWSIPSPPRVYRGDRDLLLKIDTAAAGWFPRERQKGMSYWRRPFQIPGMERNFLLLGAL